jgi:hypothetical protein
LKKASLETQTVFSESEKAQLEGDQQHDRLNMRVFNGETENELWCFLPFQRFVPSVLEEFMKQGQKVSELKSHILAG